ncbi:MAG: tRNA (guanosine(37)-N1)-methyltransferase TrmD [Anaerolineae bacterium]|nr:tRNA (guanosine(37)-N1)-methyltransferase TrmD [Anaerolineae bacterium]
MRIDVITLFPEYFESPLRVSILKRAQESGHVQIAVHSLRAFGLGRHRVTDDTPYGGGGGMVMRPEPIFEAVEQILADVPPDARGEIPIVLLDPGGRRFTQEVAWELSHHPRLVLICGHYEGVDERVREHLVTDEISIGDFILTGGEPAALVIIDAVVRLLPGVLGDPEAPHDDSFAQGLLEYPHYTRPAVYRGWEVPEILRSGHHQAIARWRRMQSLRRTWERRPDLLLRAVLTEEERTWIARWEAERHALLKPLLEGETA